MEHAYPIVERLKEHTEYASKIQENDADFNNVILRIMNSLDEYELWFTSLKEEGMIRELDSIDGDLLNHLVGLSSFVNQRRRHGQPYISQNIESFSRLCASSEKLLGNWLMS